MNISTNVNISGSIQPKLNALRQAMAATNKNIKFSQGFRVVVYSGNNREEANKVISEVRKLTTETPELVYEQPNFRVKLGNFFTRADAFALYTQIKSNYPNAVIVNDRITIPIEKYRSN
ncbi:MAG: SPOR domain-containing protein [Cytophagales bacterium]|nr:SPOR domain-containing protein [Bernardetiaceae bacterium]MDW8205565.1 SPOR domain-containing protein [Cytophagales bacterium]